VDPAKIDRIPEINAKLVEQKDISMSIRETLIYGFQNPESKQVETTGNK